VNNFAQAFFPPADQYTTAMTIAYHLRKIWNDPLRLQPTVLTPKTPGDWLIAGHSLGGGLAAAASVVSSFHATTFNAAGVNYVTVQQFDTDNLVGLNITSQAQLQSRAQGLVTSYVVDDEILNYYQDNPSMIALVSPAAYLLLLATGLPPQSIGTRVTLDSDTTILGEGLLALYQRFTLHSYYIESLLLSYGFPLS
jgi:hypothetical protein